MTDVGPEALADIAVAAVVAASSGLPLPPADGPEARRVLHVVEAIAAARPAQPSP